MLDSLVVPQFLAVASAVVFFLRVLFLYKPGQNIYARYRPSSSADHVARAQSAPELKGMAVSTPRLLILIGCLTLFGISIAILCAEGRNRSNTYMCITFAYNVFLALMSTFSVTKIFKAASTHLIILLFVTFGVYVYRDVFPLTTFTKNPVDLSEGPLLWSKIFILGLTSVVIPLVTPRSYIPVDSDFPAPVPNPEQTASILSFALWSFLDPVVYLANQVSHLSYDQLPPLADYDEAENLAKKSFPHLDPFLNHKKRHIFWGFMSIYRYEFSGQALLMVIQVLAHIASPIGINQLLKYIEHGEEQATIRPWLWIVWLFVGPTTASVAAQWCSYLGMRTLVRTEGIITQLVFEHALRVRMKAESSDGDTTAVPTPDNASVANAESASGDLSRASLASEQLLTQGKSVAQEFESQADASESNDSASGNLTGKINNLVTTDMGNITDARDFLLLVVYIPLQIILCVWFLCDVLGWSTFVGMVIMVICIPLPGYVAKSMNTVQQEQMKKTDARIQTVTETLSALRMIKLFGWESKVNARLQEKRKEELVWTRKAKVLHIINSNVTFIMPLATMAATYSTYTLIMKRELSASSVFSSMAAFDILRRQLWDVLRHVPTTIQGKVSLDRVNDFLTNTELLDEYSHQKEGPELRVEQSSIDHDAIGFCDAKFTWSGTLAPSRHQFSLHIDDELLFQRGCLNMIVGPTGSGKTSLLMALLGEMHFTPSTPHSWFNLPRNRGVAYAAQESWVQNGTIKENILFGAAYDEARYLKVLHQCALTRDLELFDAGDETEVGEKGLTLSGGQKARITLARVVYSPAEIMLLDDVLAALDVHTSKWIVKQCFGGDLMQGRTVILVTHNIALVSPIARFVVSLGTDGRIVSRGSFSEVLAKDHSLIVEVQDAQLSADNLDNRVDTKADAARPDGKLIANEEIAEGHVSWQAFKGFIVALGGKHPILFWLGFWGGLFLTAAVDSWGPWWMGQWASQYETHPPSEVSVSYYLAIYAISLVIDAVVYSTACLVYMYGALRVSQSAHEELMNSVLGTTLRWLDKTPTSRVIARCTQDIRAVDGPVTEFFEYVSDLSLSLIVKLVIIIALAPIFVTPSIGVLIIGAWCGQVYIKTMLPVKREMSNARAPVLAHFGAAVTGLVSIRAFGAQNVFKSESMGRINKYTRTARIFNNLKCWLTLRIEILGAFFSAGLATYLVYGGGSAASAAKIGFLLSMADSFNYMILHWINCVNEFEISSNSLERIRQYVIIEQEPATTIRGVPPAYWPASGDIKVENLSARYSLDGPNVLHNVSFHIKGGERIGVVGRTGSGKSSLTLALLRCILTEGNVYYDGLPTNSLNLDALRSNITIIPQPELLSGTLRQNLDPFDQYDDVMLNDALRGAGLYSLQGDMVEGRITLDSLISSGGGNLSVGQRQILALTRAIVRGSKLLILDEATSAIDYKTDAVIQQSLRNDLGADVTIITVAHRLQTIMDADRIMVLDAGRIVEFDSPAELLRNEKGSLRALVDESKDKDVLLAMAKGQVSILT